MLEEDNDIEIKNLFCHYFIRSKEPKYILDKIKDSYTKINDIYKEILGTFDDPKIPDLYRDVEKAKFVFSEAEAALEACIP